MSASAESVTPSQLATPTVLATPITLDTPPQCSTSPTVNHQDLGSAKIRTVFIKNLSPSVDSVFLKITCSPYGDVSNVKVIKEADGTSKGFAFVTFKEAQQAKKAIAMLNGKEMEGRVLFAGPAIKKGSRYSQQKSQMASKSKQHSSTQLHSPTKDRGIDRPKQHNQRSHHIHPSSGQNRDMLMQHQPSSSRPLPVHTSDTSPQRQRRAFPNTQLKEKYTKNTTVFSEQYKARSSINMDIASNKSTTSVDYCTQLSSDYWATNNHYVDKPNRSEYKHSDTQIISFPKPTQHSVGFPLETIQLPQIKQQSSQNVCINVNHFHRSFKKSSKHRQLKPLTQRLDHITDNANNIPLPHLTNLHVPNAETSWQKSIQSVYMKVENEKRNAKMRNGRLSLSVQPNSCSRERRKTKTHESKNYEVRRPLHDKKSQNTSLKKFSTNDTEQEIKESIYDRTKLDRSDRDFNCLPEQRSNLEEKTQSQQDVKAETISKYDKDSKPFNSLTIIKSQVDDQLSESKEVDESNPRSQTCDIRTPLKAIMNQSPPRCVRKQKHDSKGLFQDFNVLPLKHAQYTSSSFSEHCIKDMCGDLNAYMKEESGSNPSGLPWKEEQWQNEKVDRCLNPLRGTMEQNYLPEEFPYTDCASAENWQSCYQNSPAAIAEYMHSPVSNHTVKSEYNLSPTANYQEQSYLIYAPESSHLAQSEYMASPVSNPQPEGYNLYVKRLSDDIDNDALREIFSQFGDVVSAKVMRDADKSRGFGFVCFTRAEDAARAARDMRRNTNDVNKHNLYVAPAQRKEERQAFFREKFRSKGSSGFQNKTNGTVYPLNMTSGSNNASDRSNALNSDLLLDTIGFNSSIPITTLNMRTSSKSECTRQQNLSSQCKFSSRRLSSQTRSQRLRTFECLDIEKLRTPLIKTRELLPNIIGEKKETIHLDEPQIQNDDCKFGSFIQSTETQKCDRNFVSKSRSESKTVHKTKRHKLSPIGSGMANIRHGYNTITQNHLQNGQMKNKSDLEMSCVTSEGVESPTQLICSFPPQCLKPSIEIRQQLSRNFSSVTMGHDTTSRVSNLSQLEKPYQPDHTKSKPQHNDTSIFNLVCLNCVKAPPSVNTCYQKNALCSRIPDTCKQDNSSYPRIPDTCNQDNSSYPRVPGTRNQDNASGSQIPDTFSQDNSSCSRIPDSNHAFTSDVIIFDNVVSNK